MFSEQFDLAIGPGPRVYFDLDLVIKSNIDDIVNHNNGTLTLIHAVWREEHDRSLPNFHHMFNSSCMTWESPNTRALWEHLMQDPEMFMTKYSWGMDSFLSYESPKIPYDIQYFPPLKFYSFLYGVNFKENFKYDPDGSYKPSKFTMIADSIPIVLLNGPTQPEDYKHFRRFYED
jgi:hypothetical protein